MLEELSFLEGLNQDDMNDVVDYSRLDNTDLESENLLFSINKVTVNSIHQSVDAAVILFESLVVLYSEITNPLLLVDNNVDQIVEELTLLVKQFTRKSIELKVKDSAENVEVSTSILDQGRCDLLRTKSLSSLASERQTLFERDSFNATRVIDNLSGCPSFLYDRALDIAFNGVIIPVSDTFIEQLYQIL